MSSQSVLPAWSIVTTWGCYACQLCLPGHLWSALSTYGFLRVTYGSSALCNQLSSIWPGCCACLVFSAYYCLLCLHGPLPLCLYAQNRYVWYPAWMCSASYACLVCYGYVLVMPTHVVSIACLVGCGLPCHACPVASACLVFYTYAWSAVPTCLSGHLCLILVLLYSLLCFGSVQHFMFTLMFSYVMQLDNYILQKSR